jgi:glycosyltransferase involved in cell wall biosynthesis
MIDHHRRKGTWTAKVDLFFVLSCFMRDKFVTAGLPASRIVIKPNFALTPAPRDRSIARSGALFVGRLTEEKGLRPLIEAWRSVGHPLRIAGDGPLLEELRQRAPPNVRLIGWVDQAKLHQEMDRAAVLIVPSTYYEGFPLVIAEAYAHALPVLASRIGTLAEIVREEQTGGLFTPGDPADIARCANEMLALPTRLQYFGDNARQMFDREYSADAVYRVMLRAYRGLIAGATAGQSSKR